MNDNELKQYDKLIIAIFLVLILFLSFKRLKKNYYFFVVKKSLKLLFSVLLKHMDFFPYFWHLSEKIENRFSNLLFYMNNTFSKVSAIKL